MPEYLGPNSLAELSRLVKKDISEIDVSDGDYNEKPSEGEAIKYTFGHGLKVSEENEVSVNSTSNFEGDNTLPMTAAGVETIVGSIETLLKTI